MEQIKNKSKRAGLAQSLAQNTFWVGTSNVLQYVISFVFSVYLARMLGDIEYGKYSLSASFTAIPIFFVNLGFRIILIRDVAQHKSTADGYVGSVSLIKLMISPFVFILTLVMTRVLNYDSEVQHLVVVFFLSSLANSFTGIFLGAFVAFERMALESILLLVQRIALAAIGLFALSSGLGLLGFAYSILATDAIFMLLSGVAYYICVSPVGRITVRLDLAFYRYLATENAPLFIAGACYLIYRRVDTILLSKLTTDPGVLGWYGLAFRIFFLLQMVASTYSKVVYPIISKLQRSNKEALDRVIDKSIKLLLFVEIPIAFGLFSISKPLILTLYNNSFFESAVLLQIMCWALVINALTTLFINHLNATRRQDQNAKSVFIAMVINIVLNLILIPRYKHIGASIALLLGECAYFAGIFLSVRDGIGQKIVKHAKKPILASSVMAISLYFLSSVNLILAIVFGAMIYFALLIAMKAFDKVDRILLGHIFRKIIDRVSLPTTSKEPEG